MEKPVTWGDLTVMAASIALALIAGKAHKWATGELGWSQWQFAAAFVGAVIVFFVVVVAAACWQGERDYRAGLKRERNGD